MIEEAYKMINEAGFDNFSVRILSKRLDVSHNAMYKHFTSKAELLFEVVKLGFNNMTSAFKEINERTDIDELTKFKDASLLTMANTTWAFAHGMAMLLIDNIIPKIKDLDSLPQLLNVQAINKEAPARDIVKNCIEMFFDGLVTKKRTLFL